MALETFEILFCSHLLLLLTLMQRQSAKRKTIKFLGSLRLSARRGLTISFLSFFLRPHDYSFHFLEIFAVVKKDTFHVDAHGIFCESLRHYSR